MTMQKAPLIGICRHRLSVDGEGVTTLVAFHGSRFIAVIVSTHNACNPTGCGAR